MLNIQENRCPSLEDVLLLQKRNYSTAMQMQNAMVHPKETILKYIHYEVVRRSSGFYILRCTYNRAESKWLASEVNMEDWTQSLWNVKYFCTWFLSMLYFVHFSHTACQLDSNPSSNPRLDRGIINFLFWFSHTLPLPVRPTKCNLDDPIIRYVFV